MDQNNSSRRSFLKNVSFATAFFAVGGHKKLALPLFLRIEIKLLYDLLLHLTHTTDSQAHHMMP